jgi:hypothetical protein
MVNLCCVEGCVNRRKKTVDAKYHSFPVMSPELLSHWISRCQMMPMDASKLNNRQVCCLHFRLEDFIINSKRLLPAAYPTLFLPSMTINLELAEEMDMDAEDDEEPETIRYNPDHAILASFNKYMEEETSA